MSIFLLVIVVTFPQFHYLYSSNQSSRSRTLSSYFIHLAISILSAVLNLEMWYHRLKQLQDKDISYIRSRGPVTWNKPPKEIQKSSSIFI